MRSYRPAQVLPSEITPREVYLGRRQFLTGTIAAGLALQASKGMARPLQAVRSKYAVDDKVTPIKDVTTYNNFYEFGLGKDDPSANAGKFKPLPWTVEVDGLVARPGTFDIDQLIKLFPPEERIYRMRCVEAWSMVIPWDGFPLVALLDKVEPLGSAKYVAFETVMRPSEMPGQSSLLQSLPWPYIEGLRLDEARHPLTLLAVGLYGQTLPNQNGAPIRLVVPWKYGFKGIKSIVRITLTDKQPKNTWQVVNPAEYGFYANVNPAVDHPRWSQATERPIGESGFFSASRQATLPFNGYADEVAGLYSGMDLKKYF